MAGQKYEEVRQHLVRFFTCWGCSEPEDLADHTIDRLVPWMEMRNWESSGEPIRLFYGFARNMRHEERRKPQVEPLSAHMPEMPAITEDKEHDFACLEACISALSADEGNLIRHYYEYDPQEKVKKHQALAKRLGIGINALRIRAWKIRSTLRGCVDKCIESKQLN